jgi:hypothetical protein
MFLIFFFLPSFLTSYDSVLRQAVYVGFLEMDAPREDVHPALLLAVPLLCRFPLPVRQRLSIGIETRSL